jgi:hypothetical protein
MPYSIIEIVYGDLNKTRHIIDIITSDYVYYTHGWTGEKLRYSKLNNSFESKGRDDKWYPFNVNVQINKVNIIKKS